MPIKKTAITKKSPSKKVAVKKAPIKKTTKKAPAKKVAKTTKATAAKKPHKDLVIASDQESFWVQNGEILNSLIALDHSLQSMDVDSWQFHATGGQNDFAVWVETVLCDKRCAADLKKATTPKKAAATVKKHLKTYIV